MNKCNFCNAELKTISSLNYHKRVNKKCINIQKNEFENTNITIFKCEFCDKNLATKQSQIKHYEICKSKKENDKLKEENEKYDKIIIELETIIKEKEKYILKLEEQNKIYIEHMKDLSSKPIKENDEEEYRISIDIQPYLTSDVIYFFEFHPKDEETEENIHYFEYGTTSNIQQRHTSYGKNYRLDKVFVYKNRYLASVGEKYLKQIITDLKLRYLYKNKLECMKSSYTDLEKVYEIMEKHCIYSKEEKLNKSNEMEKYNLISSLFKDNLITFEQFENCIVKLNLSF
jgi:hypothetical protein